MTFAIRGPCPPALRASPRGIFAKMKQQGAPVVHLFRKYPGGNRNAVGGKAPRGAGFVPGVNLVKACGPVEKDRA